MNSWSFWYELPLVQCICNKRMGWNEFEMKRERMMRNKQIRTHQKNNNNNNFVYVQHTHNTHSRNWRFSMISKSFVFVSPSSLLCGFRLIPEINWRNSNGECRWTTLPRKIDHWGGGKDTITGSCSIDQMFNRQRPIQLHKFASNTGNCTMYVIASHTIETLSSFLLLLLFWFSLYAIRADTSGRLVASQLHTTSGMFVNSGCWQIEHLLA